MFKKFFAVYLKAEEALINRIKKHRSRLRVIEGEINFLTEKLNSAIRSEKINKEGLDRS